ncbi:hypothetical protein EDD11_007643 [Mortierella claussenii]|nr:hypothetical protein EDD11_007643 [Mortierella claussenii]
MSAVVRHKEALDAAISRLADHRKYHTDLVSELKTLLTNVQASVSSAATASEAHQPSDNVATVLGKQVKRLFNQSLSTLGTWSELLEAPDASDVVPASSTSAGQTTNTATSSTATSAAPPISVATVITTMSAHATTTTKQSAVAGSRSRLVTSISKTNSASRNQAPVAEDTQAHKRVGLMRGRSATSTTSIPAKTDTRSTKSMATTTKGARAIVLGAQGQQLKTKTEPSKSTGVAIVTRTQVIDENSIYNTDRPTYAHIAVLVDVGFLSVRTLELMGKDISTSLFEIEKARSNLISKIIQLGMKKRALQELGFLREQLIQCAMSLWNEIDLETRDELHQRSQAESKDASSSAESIKKTYQHLFTFPFPKALSTLTLDSLPNGSSSAASGLDQVLTFIRLVQALHNNAIRCWMDVRNGSLAYLLPGMMSQQDSPFDWCMCIAKFHQLASQQSLDALFRLLFIAAGKALESNPAHEGHCHAFVLRMHGIRYHGAYRHLVGNNDGMIWDKILRCGAEYEKATRDGQTVEDISLLLNSYRSTFEFLNALTPVQLDHPRFLEWHKHLAFFARKVDDTSIKAFSKSLRPDDQDQEMIEATTLTTTQQHALITRHSSSPTLLSETRPKIPIITRSTTDLTSLVNVASKEQVLGRLDDAVKALRRFEDCLQTWHSSSSQDPATLQNIARIFRSMDTIRSIGSKIMDICENGSSMATPIATSADVQLQWLGCIQTVTQVLSDLTAGLWNQIHASYLILYNTDRKATPDPTKLSCARVDAILFLFRLYQSNLRVPAIMTTPILGYLESAFAMARGMNDNESLPWISNALYNLGGALFKANKREEAIRPLQAAIECYLVWLHDDLSVDNSLDSHGSKKCKASERLVLANRYEVLGVCLQAANDLGRALECFNSGLCVLPLDSFQVIDTVMLGDLKTSQLPAAKLLNRRTRTMLMMKEARFISAVAAVPEFEAKLSQEGVPIHIRGIVQEFECRLLSVLSVRTDQMSLRTQEQVDILRQLMAKTYRGGRALTNPVRRARVLIQLAVLYQGNAEMNLQQEALHLVEEAIEILKDKDLKADFDLEHVRNHNLAMAYSWSGILDRHRGDGLSRRSKPFQIALQLWELMLSNIECFVSFEDAQLVNHLARVQQVKKQLLEPELLFDHLQMLADCLGMIDYRVLQVQVYLLMLRLCNGVINVTESICADAVRIYARMGQAYLDLGYSGKAKMALNHGRCILEEMSRASKESPLHGEVYATWLLVYSLYLMSVGHKTQGVTAYNQAKLHSDQHQSLVGQHDSITGLMPKSGLISRKIGAKVCRAMVVVEASLARSQLLFYEGNLSEAITDSRRAGRQLSRIVSTLSVAIRTAQADPNIVTKRSMANPFLVQEPSKDEREAASQEQGSGESRHLRQGLEKLATQRYQWSIFRLLIEAYHQLGKLYLIQGSAREAEYFFKEGKHIAQLSKAGKSMDRFLLDQAELKLRQHEWLESQEILQELAMQEDGSNAGALVWEIQDVKIQLLNGDLLFVTGQLQQSLKAYHRTDEVLSRLMDKSFISELEQLVIREPQTPREAKLITRDQLQDVREQGALRVGTSTTFASHGTGVPDQAQFECVTLGGIKAAMGYRTGLIFGLEGRRLQAYERIEASRIEDPMELMIAEYHFSRAKVLIMELEDAMAKHLMYAMIPDSALSVGLFRKARSPQPMSPPVFFNQHSAQQLQGISGAMVPSGNSLLSSPSVRVTRMTRRRRSQLAQESPMHSPSSRRGAKGAPHGSKTLTDHYRNLLWQAREHLSAAYGHSVEAHPPHVVSEICSKQAHLSILEACFYQEVLQGRTQGEETEALSEDDKNGRQWVMASLASCYLEMAKGVTQHREMLGLIKQKLNPDLPQEDQTWPKDIQLRDQEHLGDLAQSRVMHTAQAPRQRRLGNKTINLVGLEKPRRLVLVADAKDEEEVHDDFGFDEEDDEDMDLKNVGMEAKDIQTRRGKREYFNRQSKLYASTSLGNERSFLHILNQAYQRDTLAMEGQNDAFQRDFIDIIPEKWTVVSLSIDVEHEILYVNRMRANTMPVVVRLPLNRAQLRDGDDQDLGLWRGLGFDDEDEAEEPPTTYALSYKRAVEELQDILRCSQETLAQTSSKQHAAATGSTRFVPRNAELSREAKAEWWSRRQRLDERLSALLGLMEDQWLCGLKGLIQSHNTPAKDENLMDFKRTLEWIMSQAVHSMSSAPSRAGTRTSNRRASSSRRGQCVQLEIHVELCRVILHLGDRPSFMELKDLIYFLLDAYLYKNVTESSSATLPASGVPLMAMPSSPVIEYSEVQFDRIASQIKEALHCYWLAETEDKNNGFDDGAHVILILDKHLQMFPWESCPVLREEAVSRVPSMYFLRDRILQQKHHLAQSSIGDASLTDLNRSREWQDLEVNPQRTYYVLNPGGDLKSTEEEFKDYVESQEGWEGIVGRAPMDLECINGLSKHDLYIYFGHSGGEQYVRSTQIRQLGDCAVSLLLGCSSGCLTGEGEFDPTGNVMNYLLAGCPSVVANLWDVTDRDLDRFSMATFKLWGLDANRHISSQSQTEQGSKRRYVGQEDHTMEGIEEAAVDDDEDGEDEQGLQSQGYGLRLSLVEAVKEAREECKLKYLVGAASVVRLIQVWPRLVVALVSLYGIYFAVAALDFGNRQIQILKGPPDCVYISDKVPLGFEDASCLLKQIPRVRCSSSPPPPPTRPINAAPGDLTGFLSPTKFEPPQLAFSSSNNNAKNSNSRNNKDNNNAGLSSAQTNDVGRSTPAGTAHTDPLHLNNSKVDHGNHIERNAARGPSSNSNTPVHFGSTPLVVGQTSVYASLGMDFDGHTEAAAIYTLLVISSLSIIDNAIGLMVATRKSLRLTQVAFAIWCLRFTFRLLSLISVVCILIVGAETQTNGTLLDSNLEPRFPLGDGHRDDGNSSHLGNNYTNYNGGSGGTSGVYLIAPRMITVTVLELIIAAVHGWSLLVLIRDLRNQPRPRTVLTRAWSWFCMSRWGKRLGLEHWATGPWSSSSSSSMGYDGLEYYGPYSNNSASHFATTHGLAGDSESVHSVRSVGSSGGHSSIWDRDTAASLGLRSGLMSSASSMRSVAISIPERMSTPVNGVTGRSRTSSISSFSSSEKI